MKTALEWLLVILIVATQALAVASWLVGEDGIARVKNRLANWYVYIEDGDWTRFMSSAAGLTEQFLSHVLGSRLLSLRSVAIWFAVSIPITFAAFSTNGVLRQFGIPTSVAGVVGVFLIDFVFLNIGRVFLRRLALSSGTRGAIGFLVYSLGAAYLAIGCFIAAGSFAWMDRNSARIHISGTIANWVYSAITWPSVFAELVNGLPFAEAKPYRYSLGGGVLMILPAGLSTLLYATVIAGAALIYVIHTHRRHTMALLIERIAGLKGGVLTALSTAVTAVTAITTALLNVHSGGRP